MVNANNRPTASFIYNFIYSLEVSLTIYRATASGGSPTLDAGSVDPQLIA
jgi:hypothetical protein